MVNKELLSYIRTQKDLGKTETEIKSVLTDGGGWSAVDIDEAFRVQDMKKRLSSRQKNDAFIFLGIASLVILFLFLWFLFWVVSSLENPPNIPGTGIGIFLNHSFNDMFSVVSLT